jgi:hypothetical protein
MRALRGAAWAAGLLLIPLLLAGCGGNFWITVENRDARPIHNLIVDYPGGTFGTPHLAPGADFRYQVKLKAGNGKVKITWDDDHGKTHSQEGPELKAGEDGSLIAGIRGDKVEWATTRR